MFIKKIAPIAALLTGLGVAHVLANDIEPTKEKYTSPFTLTPIVLDGSLSEWGGVGQIVDPKFAVPKGSGGSANANYVLFEEYAGGTWTGPDDQTSAVQVAYDAENVYFGFVVTDDYHENAAHSAWNGDSVQLMIANSTRTQQVALYNYALGGVEGATDDTIVNHEAGPGGTEAIVTRDDVKKKTYYEIKLPAAALGLTAPLKAGTKFGLGMAINDGDEAQPGQKGWGGLGAHALVFGKSPGETAEVTLGASETTIELLGIGAESLLGGDLTDPENDGNEDAGPNDPSWNWVGITSNNEPSFGGGENSFNIFDNKVGGGNDKWCCDDPTEANPLFVAVQFANPVSLTHFTITSGNDTPSRRPTKFQIQGSQDGANYSPIYVQNGSSETDIWDAENQVAKFTLPIPSVPFRYIRYFVTETPGTLHQINEIEYFGTYGGTALAFFSAINPTITSFSFRLSDSGASEATPSSVKLSIDGVEIALGTVTKTDGKIDVSYKPATQFLPGSTHTYAISAKDGLGNNIVSEGTFTTQNYALFTAADKVTPVTAKPGFLFNVVQNSAFGANDNTRPVQQLAGKLGKNFADKDAPGAAIGSGTPGATENDPIAFEIDSVINLNQDVGAAAGNFPDDLGIPGIPGLGEAGQTDGIAAEVLTFIELPAGSTTMIFNSDDGFRTTGGNIRDIFQAKFGGEFVGGRGASDTSFTVFAETAGIYPFRTIWYEGGGGANLEWLTVKADGTKVLVNDTANGGLKAYRAITGANPTAVTSVSPLAGSGLNLADTSIEAVISEGANAITAGSIVLKLDGNTVAATLNKVGNVTTVSFKPSSPLSVGQHTATLAFTAGAARSDSWSFTIPPSTKDKVGGYPGLITGSAVYTADAGGHTAKAGDFAIDTTIRGGPVATFAPAFLAAVNAATANDELSISFWQKKHDTSDSSAFVMHSPSTGNNRAFHAHVPWSNQNIYFDTVGCCDGTTQRITADINTFPDYTTGDPRDNLWWTTQWHHFVFTKKGATKNIYIDGKLFLTGESTAAMPTDINAFYMGSGAGGTVELSHGLQDDFSVYSKELSEANALALSKGTLPTALPAATGLIGYWDFNDKVVAPPTPPTLSIAPGAAGKVVVTFEGTLQKTSTLGGAFTDVTGSSPLTLDAAAATEFLRAIRK